MEASCGALYSAALDSERATKSLVELGGAAMPDLEDELDSIERGGEVSALFSNDAWLLFAYARIYGPAAFPRLHRLARLARGPDLADLRGGLDSSIAASLGLTSYVSGVREPMDGFHSVLDFSLAASLGLSSDGSTLGPMPVVRCGPQEPRDALDEVILAWERNDRRWLEKNLGPRAKAVLNSMLKGKAWADLRTELWPGTSDRDDVALGYRLKIPGLWAEPAMAQPIAQSWGKSDFRGDPTDPAISTQFTNSVGKDCGERVVEFSQDGGPRKYLVDDPNIGYLLRLIGACAATPTAKP